MKCLLFPVSKKREASSRCSFVSLSRHDLHVDGVFWLLADGLPYALADADDSLRSHIAKGVNRGRGHGEVAQVPGQGGRRRARGLQGTRQ